MTPFLGTQHNQSFRILATSVPVKERPVDLGSDPNSGNTVVSGLMAMEFLVDCFIKPYFE